MTCSLLWVRCLFDRFSILDFGGKWPLKWKFSKISFRIPRRDTEVRFVTKFGENRPLRSCRKVAWFTYTQKNSRSAGLVPAPFCPKWASPILPKMGRSRPKIPERCPHLTCPHRPNLIRIGCVFPDLFPKDWFFGPKSHYNNRLSAYKYIKITFSVVRFSFRRCRNARLTMIPSFCNLLHRTLST